MSMKVLVVDDSGLIRKIAKTNLVKLGVNEVFEAGDGQRAYSLMLSNPDITLILTDYHMPIMDGLEFIRKVRNDKRFKRLKIVAISSALDDNVMKEFNNLDVTTFIHKPFNINDFENSVRPIVDSLKRGDDLSSADIGIEEFSAIFRDEIPQVETGAYGVKIIFSKVEITLDVDTIKAQGKIKVNV